MDDWDGAPHPSGSLAVSGIRREDPIREVPEPRSLRLVDDDLRVEPLAAELDLGVDAKIGKPGRVLRQTPIRPPLSRIRTGSSFHTTFLDSQPIARVPASHA